MVACSPLPQEAKAPVNSIASLMDKVENLRPLKVVITTEDDVFRAGDEVFLRSESYDHPSLKKVYYIDNMPFILIDKAIIIACKHGTTRWPNFMRQPFLQSEPYSQPTYPVPGWPQPVNPSYTVFYGTSSTKTDIK